MLPQKLSPSQALQCTKSAGHSIKLFHHLSARDVARGCNGCQCTRKTQRGPRGPLFRLCGVTIVNFLEIPTYEASCSEMHSFVVLGAPTKTNHPGWGPLKQAGAQSNSKKGPFGDYGVPWTPCTSGPHWPDAPVSKSPSYVYALSSARSPSACAYSCMTAYPELSRSRTTSVCAGRAKSPPAFRPTPGP